MFTMQRIAQIIDTTIKQEAHLKPSPVFRKLFTKKFFSIYENHSIFEV